jgi:hypothetical protein
MKKENKIILFTIIVSILVVALVVYRYEKLLAEIGKENKYPMVKDGIVPKEYSASAIIKLIQKDSLYIGDSVTIMQNGKLLSDNSKFQGTINAVMAKQDNVDIIKNKAETTQLPFQYCLYVLAAGYYRDQYPLEFKTHRHL